MSFVFNSLLIQIHILLSEWESLSGSQRWAGSPSCCECARLLVTLLLFHSSKTSTSLLSAEHTSTYRRRKSAWRWSWLMMIGTKCQKYQPISYSYYVVVVQADVGKAAHPYSACKWQRLRGGSVRAAINLRRPCLQRRWGGARQLAATCDDFCWDTGNVWS